MRQVAIVILEGAKPLDVGIPAQVFATRASMPFNVVTCGLTSGPVIGADGLKYLVDYDLSVLETVDLIFIPGYSHPDTTPAPRELISALQRAASSGTTIAAISTGAFVLAATGLLNGKRATTHWHYSDQFLTRFPQVTLEDGVLFVDEGQILTSAGGASGLDLCLHILRRELGLTTANHASRRLVAAPYRSGGQAQYIQRSVPAPTGERFAGTRAWALEHLHDPLTVAELAAHASVSERTFARTFLAETGVSPMRWIMRARIDLARELLEHSDLSIDHIAAQTGIGSAANLRQHFRRILNTSPAEYRRTFTAHR